MCSRAPGSYNTSSMEKPNKHTPWDLNELVPTPLGNNETVLQRFFPFPERVDPFAPCIYHIITPIGLTEFTSLQNYILFHTDLTPMNIKYLADMGAIYVRACNYSPRISPRPTRQTVGMIQGVMPINTPLYVRIYKNPKRHAAVTNFHLLESNSMYLVVCKPAGLPSCPTLDNCRENLIRDTEIVLDLVPHTLCVTTRLDLCTSGILVLTLRKHAAEMNAFLNSSEKRYLVHTKKRVPIGLMSDWYHKKSRLGVGPCDMPLLRRHSEGENPPRGYCFVSLLVEKCGVEGFGYKSMVKLITGKTHQIRMQFSARGVPVNGDTKYGRIANKVYGWGYSLGSDPRVIGLHLTEIKGKLKDTEVTLSSSWEQRGDCPYDT